MWFADQTDDVVVEVVGKFASWSDVAACDGGLSDVVILEVFLGDQVPLRTKIASLLSVGSEVVISSHLDDKDVALQAYQAGARAFVPKTFSAETLSSAVRAAARGELTVLPGFASRLPSAGAGLRLTNREHQVVTLYLGQGLTRAQIAQCLGISVHTVKKLLISARDKAGGDQGRPTRLALRSRLIKEGWLPPDTLAGQAFACEKRDDCPPLGCPNNALISSLSNGFIVPGRNARPLSGR